MAAVYCIASRAFEVVLNLTDEIASPLYNLFLSSGRNLRESGGGNQSKMGAALKKMFDNMFGTKEMRVVMLGLDAAGKTTILYKLHIGEVQSTVPTLGFNVEKVQYKNVQFTVWDVGGQEKLRPLWRHYFNNTGGLEWQFLWYLSFGEKEGKQ